jgi:cytochrome c
MSRLAVLSLALVAILAAAAARAEEGAIAQGGKLFGACAACHSLAPDRNMTGPSLAGVWGRKAGGLKSFERYSPAVSGSDVVWNEETLDRWLQSPAGFIPGNSMSFAGISDAGQRAALIGFLKEASTGRLWLPAAMTASPVEDLKKLGREHRIEAIRYCRDAYKVTTADGRTADFWEANLRFKTDSSDAGPLAGKPIIMRAGMMGDRASVFFAAPGEISTFVKHQC